MTKPLNPLIQHIVRPEILVQSSYHVQEAKDMVKLDAMENPYPLPDALKAELGARLAEVALNRYPVPDYQILKQKICRGLGVPNGLNVILGNGSDELITMLSVACAKPRATVVAPVPTFVMYAMSARQAGLQFVGVPLTADLKLDLPRLLEAIRLHRPALVFLSNPNNPTGTWFAEQDLLAVMSAMSEIGLVVVDEAYEPFAPATCMAHLPLFKNLVVMRTVSKLGLAGLRLGYMSASADILTEIDKVRPPYNINALTEAAAILLLDHLPVFHQQARQIRAERSALISALQKLDKVHVFPSEANFVLIRVPNAEQIFNKLLVRRILVKNVSQSHQLLQDCLRVTVSTPEENQLFLEALQDALQ